jgi:zinc transport system substrate-binding protein
MMKNRYILLLLAVAVAILLAACGGSAPSDETTTAPTSAASSESLTTDQADREDSEPIKVVASFHAMAELAKAVGGDLIEVSTVVPSGASVHGFEPRGADLAALSEADLFVYNGQGMEPWLEPALNSIERDDLITVDTSEGVDLLPIAEDSDGHEHDHGPNDPHIWLGISSCIQQTNQIRDAFTQFDPENGERYKKQAEVFTDTLQEYLDNARERLEGVTTRHFVTGHNAFGYLARDLDLEQSAVQGIYAEGEPTAQGLAKIVEEVRGKGVSVVFFENQASPAVSTALATELGADTRQIYTMESAENDLTFLERVEYNLNAIVESLTAQ